MIEGGNAGGSAQSQAAERRAHAERLQAEATRLDVVAADERATASRLATLPESYVILHDLTLPDGRGRVDHVVIGPGGAFLVITRRVAGDVGFAHGQLTSGGAAISGVVESTRAEAQALTSALGTPVVPVIGLTGAAFGADVPGAVGGALVCPADQVAAVVGRGSHTLLPSTKVGEVADRAIPLLAMPGVRSRSVAPAAPLASPLPPPPPPTHAVPAAAAAPVVAASAEPERGRRAARSEHDRRSRRFVITAVVSICLVAFAAGGLLRVLFADDAATPSTVLSGSSVVGSDASVASTTTLEVPTSVANSEATSDGGSTTVPKVAQIAAPKVAVLPVCQTPGTGWSLVPAWPGPVKNLAHYDVQVLGPDGKWVTVSSFVKTTTAAGAITGQQPNVTLTVQFIAVLKSGARSPGTPTPVLTPATSC